MTDRNPDGTFAKGNKASTGRKSREVEAAALDKFRKHFNNGNLTSVLESLQRQANRGNVQAIRLVLEYMMGKPSQEVDLNQDGIVKIIVEYERDTNTVT